MKLYTAGKRFTGSAIVILFCLSSFFRAVPAAEQTAGTVRDNRKQVSPSVTEEARQGRDRLSPAKDKHGGKDRGFDLTKPDGSWTPASFILGRPAADAVTVSVLAEKSMSGYLEYGSTGGPFSGVTDRQRFEPGQPVEVRLAGLSADTEYTYRLRYSVRGDAQFETGPEYTFHTQRKSGSGFVFEVQGDSHPEREHQHDPSLYARVLRAAAADRPDFYLCMGDDFSVDTLREINPDTVDAIYRYQRNYLSLVGASAALFLVNGNHEQAAACNLDGTSDNIAVRVQNYRNKYFPQPAPDGFYTGDTERVPHIGLLRDYYAWTWGDALFVVIDPYWHSSKPVDNVFGGGKKNRDMWAVTLGDVQYKWFKQTLEQSTARYKFVFSHHVLGTGRGGVEMADLYEWGGRSRGGAMEFDSKRPGWEMPIHQLLVKNGVTIFFQGHDHIFARQEQDGVIYQTLPEPADPNCALYNQDAYRSGNTFPNSGRVRVSVNPEKVRVEYVRACLPADESVEHPAGEIVFAYEVRGADSKPPAIN